MITIITVYRSNNYGSFWQAKVLGDVLSKFDSVQYLNFGQRKWIDARFIYSIYRNMTKGFSVKKIRFIVDLFVQNYKMWKQMKVVSTRMLNENDFVVIGSDEIWNISRKNCNNPFFWGFGIRGKKISYAPSINNAPANLFNECPTAEYLQTIKKISVRDKYSKNVLSNFTKKNIAIVLDPTLLVDVAYYQKFARYKKLPFKYIALYVFPGRNSSYQEVITAFAKEHGYKIVSIGTYLSWCDLNITARNCQNPFLYYVDADFVFANTFHGTAFAINFEKQFVSFATSQKIKELLNTFGLENRNVMNVNYDEVLSKSKENIDYNIVNEKKKLLREESFGFIKESIMG